MQSFLTKARVIAPKVVPPVFYLFLVVFLVYYLKNIDWKQLEGLQISWVYVAIATILGLMFRYWAAFIWFVLLRNLGAKNFRDATTQLVYVYAKSWLGRYIPGTAPWILGKIYFASKHGISKNKLAVSSLLEGALQVVVLLALSFIMLLFDRRLDVVSGSFKLGMLAIFVVCVVAMIPAIFNRMVSFAYKLMRRKQLDVEHLPSNKTVLKGVGLYIIAALIGGLSFFFITKAVYPQVGYDNALFIIGASNLAGAVGMLALFIPSGIGVREGVFLVLLAVVMPKEIALIVVVTSRLWSVAVDLLFWAIAKVADKRADRTIPATN